MCYLIIVQIICKMQHEGSLFSNKYRYFYIFMISNIKPVDKLQNPISTDKTNKMHIFIQTFATAIYTVIITMISSYKWLATSPPSWRNMHTRSIKSYNIGAHE